MLAAVDRLAPVLDGHRVFHLVLVKPSHYDDDGYVIQWLRSAIPSNTLATLYGLALDCAERRVLGDQVELRITPIDETNTRVRPDRIADLIGKSGGRGLVALVGVQSNQFPRAMDIARRLRARGVAVAIGGFHVSGTIAMLPGLQPEVREAVDLGISIFAGEAEGRLEQVLRDADAGALKPVYNFMDDLPNIERVPAPILPRARIVRTAAGQTSFDAGRGCPFQCSFCTIINVQGRKSRRRSADDVEAIVRANLAQGIDSFFITDDNFARNRDWEPIFDRLIRLREVEKRKISFVIQVDTLCHRIPRFVEKAARAGVRRVFIGLENINPDNLLAAKKRQNRITEYRTMLQAWKHAKVLTACGYILGFPADTPETILRDIAIIQAELPVDILEFFCLTPLPGSEDHKKLHEAGVAMDPDLNSYDLTRVTTAHPRMSRAQWEDVYRRAWLAYYTPEHIERVMRRNGATGNSVGKAMFMLLWFYGCVTIEGVHPLEGGYLRLKRRRDRRPGMPLEPVWRFYPRYLAETLRKQTAIVRLVHRFSRVRRRIKSDPARRAYSDLSLSPVSADETDSLALFAVTAGGPDAVERARRQAAPIAH